MGELFPFRRRRPALPPVWAPYVMSRFFVPAPLRMMVWSGLLCGLLLFQALRLSQAPYAAAVGATAQAQDLYAEARRSRAILEAQDGAPPSALGEPAGPGASEAPPAAIAAAVRVIDGDTFDIGATRIRIADIDTPEIHGRCADESARAARATARLRALLGAGPFELRPLADGRDEDIYGRKLRIVTRYGRSLGDQLVAEGLARTWTGRREPWCGATASR
jgi:endonuclease YncB( thermonuclease family)